MKDKVQQLEQIAVVAAADVEKERQTGKLIQIDNESTEKPKTAAGQAPSHDSPLFEFCSMIDRLDATPNLLLTLNHADYKVETQVKKQEEPAPNTRVMAPLVVETGAGSPVGGGVEVYLEPEAEAHPIQSMEPKAALTSTT